MQSQATAAKQFRTAVSAGEFLQAEQLLDSYRREVEIAWKSAVSAEDRDAIANEVTSLLEWARTTTLAARSHAQHKLILLRRESAYMPSIHNAERRDFNA
jgi:hypothetical protein